MDFGALRTIVRDLNFTVAHGVAITVTGATPGAPIETRGIWGAPLVDEQAFGADLKRREPRKVMSVPRDETLTQLPRGSIIVAAELGSATARQWKVDGYVTPAEPDYFRVALVPVTEVL